MTQNSLFDALPSGTPLNNGAFVVDGVLGQGGFGITYAGQDTTLGRLVAIKELFPLDLCHRRGLRVAPADPTCPTDVGALESARQRFLCEARVLARFDHPGIVRVHAAFAENETAYMVMEHLHGPTLQERVEKSGALPEADVLHIAQNIGAALSVVHEAGLLHRDLKPANILCCEDRPAVGTSVGTSGQAVSERVVLLDFGLALEADAGGYDTRRLTGRLGLGTSGYAPLEQYGRGGSSPAADLYALGATLYFLLTGQVPVDAIARASGEVLPPPHQLVPHVSHTLSEALLWAMQLEAARRPQNVGEFLARLERQIVVPSGRSLSGDSPSHNSPSGSLSLAGPSPPSLPFLGQQSASLAPASSSPASPLPASPPLTSSWVLQPVIQRAYAAPGAVSHDPSDAWAGAGSRTGFDPAIDAPVAVRISAKIIDWPFVCACCGAAEVAFLPSSAMRSGRAVVRQTTDSWTVPFCSACLEHQAMVRHSEQIMDQARRVRSPLLIESLALDLCLSGVGGVLIWLLGFWATSLVMTWLAVGMAAAAILLLLLLCGDMGRAVQRRARRSALQQEANAVLAQGREARSPSCVSSGDNYPILYAGHFGSVHTFIIGRAQYAEQFVACNRSKVLSHE